MVGYTVVGYTPPPSARDLLDRSRLKARRAPLGAVNRRNRYAGISIQEIDRSLYSGRDPAIRICTSLFALCGQSGEDAT